MIKKSCWDGAEIDMPDYKAYEEREIDEVTGETSSIIVHLSLKD